MSLPCSDFTVATTSWMPDLSSSVFDFASTSLRLSGVMTPAWSTTRPLSAGKSSAKARLDTIQRNATHAVIPGRAKHEPGIHNHKARGSMQSEAMSWTYDYGSRAPRRVCHRSGHFGPDPLAASGTTLKLHLRRLLRTLDRSEFNHRLVSGEKRFRPEEGRESAQGRFFNPHPIDV